MYGNQLNQLGAGFAQGEPNPNGQWQQGQGQQMRGNRLTQMGYTGPMPGTSEFMAARQAGQHPIMDWRQQRPQWGGMAGNWHQPNIGNWQMANGQGIPNLGMNVPKFGNGQPQSGYPQWQGIPNLGMNVPQNGNVA